jgi:hypothetical protein
VLGHPRLTSKKFSPSGVPIIKMVIISHSRKGLRMSQMMTCQSNVFFDTPVCFPFCLSSRMGRQVSSSSPLSSSYLPCTFPASRPWILTNHPPKPPMSMYFPAHTLPARKPATTLRDMAAQHIDQGKPIPVNIDRERPSAHHHATASSVGVLRGLATSPEKTNK